MVGILQCLCMRITRGWAIWRKSEGLAFAFLLGFKRESVEGLKGGKENGFRWFYFGFPL